MGLRAWCRHWYYDDFIRPLNPGLPPKAQKTFTVEIIKATPLNEDVLREHRGGTIDWEQAWAQHMDYRREVPVCGAILLNADYTKVGPACSISVWRVS